ncbi:RNA-directed DNA polymerase, eukaryota, reverse transcriptase zinc-binding domain protein [Tanacetum coccineum]
MVAISKEEEVQKISTSIFVTNFPDHAKAKDLWNVCKQYGQVVDAFIPDRKSKAGKRYGFVRFIRVYDVDRLVSNLCTLWMGDVNLHLANVARFQRPPAVNSGGYTHQNGFIKEDFDGSDVEKEGDNNVSMVPDSVKEDVNVQAKEKEVECDKKGLWVIMKEGVADTERGIEFILVQGNATKIEIKRRGMYHYWFEIDGFEEMISKAWCECPIVEVVNASVYCFDPKIPDYAKLVKDFRPISLIGSLYKIIAKILANRLVGVLGDLVSEVQSAFVADRQILDGPLILNESLHLSFKRVEDAGMFNGIKINSSMTLSHMFYADDAIFMGQWSKRNIDTLMYMLKCFERASGLSINLSYSLTQGGLRFDREVGGCMSRIKSWDEVIDKMVNRLSKWKMKTLSIGGRLTLLKAVFGSMPIYHMSIFKVPMLVLQRMESIRCHFFNGNDLDSKRSIWVSWNKVLTSKEKGGLGVSSLFALNRALMFKWVWRFFNQSDSLWVRVIHAIHGVDGRIGRAGNVGHTSIWCDIIKEMDRLASHGIDLISMMHKKIGNGSNTSFWKDRWRGEQRLKEVFPRIYALEVNKHISVAFKFEQTSLSSSLRRMPRSGIESEQWDHLLDSLEGVMLSPSEDRWSWDLNGSGEFSVASARRYIDNNRLPDISSKTRWIKEVPIKVNVHAWKVRINGLPTRWNISRRGIDIPSILCPLCETGVESSKHLFFNCSVVRAIFRRVCIWWDVSYMELDSFDEWISWITNLRLPSKHKRLLEGVCYGLWWFIWAFRNKKIFGVVPSSKANIFDDLVLSRYSFVYGDKRGKLDDGEDRTAHDGRRLGFENEDREIWFFLERIYVAHDGRQLYFENGD